MFGRPKDPVREHGDNLLCANIMPKFSFLSSRRPFFIAAVLIHSVAVLILTATV
jgi:hypothetical protein